MAHDRYLHASPHTTTIVLLVPAHTIKSRDQSISHPHGPNILYKHLSWEGFDHNEHDWECEWEKTERIYLESHPQKADKTIAEECGVKGNENRVLAWQNNEAIVHAWRWVTDSTVALTFGEKGQWK